MTYEQAVYLKLLILCGYFEEYEQFLDVALEAEEPLSDVIVELAYCGSNEKRVLSVLSEYISEKKAEIDLYPERTYTVNGLFQRSRKNFLLQLEHFLTDGS